MSKHGAFLLFILYANFAYGDYITQNVTNGCDIDALWAANNSTDLYAIFEPIEYTCGAGYFLPADTLGCVACPNGATCAGGTFAYDANKPQGINYTTPITQNQSNACSTNYNVWSAQFDPIEYTCSAGTYLPADAIACAQCSANNYCVGGTYSYNATMSQGITPCDTGYSSVAGASSCTPNVINITWEDATPESVAANNAGSCTYGGTINTPADAPSKRGYVFTGWSFDVN